MIVAARILPIHTLRALIRGDLEVSDVVSGDGGEDLVRRSVIERAQQIKASSAANKVGITSTGAIVSATVARVVSAPQTFHN